jgi:hypothetical protein
LDDYVVIPKNAENEGRTSWKDAMNASDDVFEVARREMAEYKLIWTEGRKGEASKTWVNLLEWIKEKYGVGVEEWNTMMRQEFASWSIFIEEQEMHRK